MSYAYSAAAVIAANTSFLNLLDANASAAMIRIRDASDVLLAEITLSDPAGTVDGTTGQLTLSVATQETSAPATGTADTAEITDGAGTVHLTMPCAAGSAAASGSCVLSSLNIEAGGAVNVVSAVIG